MLKQQQQQQQLKTKYCKFKFLFEQWSEFWLTSRAVVHAGYLLALKVVSLWKFDDLGECNRFWQKLTTLRIAVQINDENKTLDETALSPVMEAFAK